MLHCKIKENAQCINAKDQADRTSLSWAPAAGKQEVVDFLVHNNGVMECSDESGWTPLHIAAFAGNEAIITALLSHGAKTSMHNNTGETPLHNAASRNRAKAAKAL